MYIVSQNGKLDGKQLLPSGYLKEATVKHSDPMENQVHGKKCRAMATRYG
ncbi:MAG: hypothetical protein ACLS9K_11820 [Lachnospira eligens]